MKVLYISSSANWGGGSVALYNLIKGLCEKHDIYVLFPKPRGRFCDELDKIGIPYYFLNYSLTVYPCTRNPVKYICALARTVFRRYISKQKLEKLIVQIKPNIVHTNVGPLDIALDVCLKYGIPHVWHQREYQDLDFGMNIFPSKRNYMKKIHKEGNYNIAITEGIFKHWQLRPIDKVIYDGVFDKDAKPCSLYVQKENYFLFAGRVEEAKGLHVLLKVFAEFCKYNKNYKLLVAGRYSESSSYKRRCDNIISNFNISEFVYFLGERDDVYKLMSHAVALVVASRFEGFGFITAEAMFNACLVIGKNTAGTKEQFDIGLKQVGKEIGLRYFTEEELLKQMQLAIRMDSLSVIKYAQEVVVSNYTNDVCSCNVEKYYNHIILRVV